MPTERKTGELGGCSRECPDPARSRHPGYRKATALCTGGIQLPDLRSNAILAGFLHKGNSLCYNHCRGQGRRSQRRLLCLAGGLSAGKLTPSTTCRAATVVTPLIITGGRVERMASSNQGVLTHC